jgi:hypothetical protein
MGRKKKENQDEFGMNAPDKTSEMRPDNVSGGTGQPLTAESVREITGDGKSDELRTKLRRKFHLLKDEPLVFETKELMLQHVCKVLGMDRPKLDWILVDL